MPPPQNTFPMDGSQRAPLRAPQGIWACIFFRRRRHFCRPDFARPPPPSPPSTRPGPLSHPPGSAGMSPMPYLSLAIQSHGPSRQIWWTGFHTAARKRRHIPLQNTSRQRFGDVLPSMNMYVYARICTYMNVYVSICMYVYVYDVYACILHVYACIFSYDPLKHGS